MANPLENMLLLQYLSGAGQDIRAGNPLGTNVNAITQQNIASRNFMKMLQKMLGGEVPEGGKITTDAKGTKIEVPKTMGSVGLAAGSQDPMAQAQPLNIGNYLNPSSSPLDISGADLAGLTPESISQALQFKFMGEELEQTKLSDAADLLYKSALTQRALTPTPTKPTAAIQNYEYYVNQQRALGKTPKTIDEWDRDTRTAYEKHYQRYKDEGGELGWHEWLRDITALGGGLDIGEFTRRREVTADVSAEKYFTDPKGMIADIDKYISSEEVQNRLFQYADDERKMQVETVRAKEKYITSKISGAGGKIVKAEVDTDTGEFIYTVKFPSGNTRVLRYKVR